MEVFDPVLYSEEENKWLLDNLDKAPIVALRDQRQGVNPTAVKPVLDRVQELEQLKIHEGITWVGVEKMKEAIKIYLRENEKWAFDNKRNKKAPRFPSLYSFDVKGKA